MNIARAFAYTRELENQRTLLLQRVNTLESEREKLIDSLAQAYKGQPIYHRPEIRPQSNVPQTAVGPTAIRAKRELEEQQRAEEIFANAEEARNGNKQPPIIELS